MTTRILVYGKVITRNLKPLLTEDRDLIAGFLGEARNHVALPLFYRLDWKYRGSHLLVVPVLRAQYPNLQTLGGLCLDVLNEGNNWPGQRLRLRASRQRWRALGDHVGAQLLCRKGQGWPEPSLFWVCFKTMGPDMIRHLGGLQVVLQQWSCYVEPVGPDDYHG